jgi:hypothetical protein
MRTRRHFQPMLDSMPVRIAPSAVGGLTQVLATTLNVNASHNITMHTDDTEMPETEPSTPTPTPTPTSTPGS